MSSDPASTWVAGVDGCREGWIAVFLDLSDAEPPRMRLYRAFADILAAPEAPFRIAVDMPIGLPDRTEGGGRVAERAVRPLLGDRQSSVFSVPSRSAVECLDYAEACRMARATSNPPRAVAKQCFALFAKMREIDALLTPGLAERIIETHPEMAFRQLNDGAPMALPKKVKNRPSEPGLKLRRDLLERLGFDAGFLTQPPLRGAGPDDLIDACVSALVAKRHALGLAIAHPTPPGRDGRGLPIAIWA